VVARALKLDVGQRYCRLDGAIGWCGGWCWTGRGWTWLEALAGSSRYYPQCCLPLFSLSLPLSSPSSCIPPLPVSLTLLYPCSNTTIAFLMNRNRQNRQIKT
jgi:hypothetical protein